MCRLKRVDELRHCNGIHSLVISHYMYSYAVISFQHIVSLISGGRYQRQCLGPVSITWLTHTTPKPPSAQVKATASPVLPVRCISIAGSPPMNLGKYNIMYIV